MCAEVPDRDATKRQDDPFAQATGTPTDAIAGDFQRIVATFGDAEARFFGPEVAQHRVASVWDGAIVLRPQGESARNTTHLEPFCLVRHLFFGHVAPSDDTLASPFQHFIDACEARFREHSAFGFLGRIRSVSYLRPFPDAISYRIGGLTANHGALDLIDGPTGRLHLEMDRLVGPIRSINGFAWRGTGA